jgi:hypothetical protein
MKNLTNLKKIFKITLFTNVKIAFFLTLLFVANFNLKAQSIKSIEIPGAIQVSSNRQEVEFYSSTDQKTNLLNYKEIKITMENTKGMYMVFDDSSGNSEWEVVQGNPKSNSYFEFCKAIQIKDNACRRTCTVSYYVRNIGQKAGEIENTIYIDLGSKKSCSYNTKSCHSVKMKVSKVAATIYTWIEPSSGTDSSYKVSTNWSPTRTSPSTNDILVVDLATTTTRNTTIDISNLTESINKFKIFGKNHVTFKCTSNTVWTVGLNSSSTGHDFVIQRTAFYRKTGSGELDIRVNGSNSTNIRGRFTNVAGKTTFSGSGTHSIYGNIFTVGGTLKFKPLSGTNTLYLTGINQSINGTGGVLEIDSAMDVTVGTGINSTLTLNRTLPLYSVLKLNDNTTLVSNTPANGSSSAFNAWEPNLQLKGTEKPGSYAYGQLDAMGSGTSISGGALFEVFNATRRSYRGFGIPMKNGVHLSQFSDDITTTGDVSGINADSFTTACSYCTHSIFRWNESSQEWMPYASGNTPTNVQFGKGLLVFFRGTYNNGLGDTSAAANYNTVGIKGQLHVGNTSYTLSKTSNTNSTLEGFNWISNPYPANLDFCKLYNSNGNSILAKYYVYDAIAKTYNSWDSCIAGQTPARSGCQQFSANTPNARFRSRIIASGASFFVKALNNGSILNFTESMKEPRLKPLTKHFHGVQELSDLPCNQLKLFLSYQTDTLADSDGFSLYYDLENENVTNDGDDYDMVKFYAGSLGIGTVTNNNQWLSIDRRSTLTEVIGGTYTVPLKIKFPKLAPKDFNIAFSTCTEETQPYRIQLIDKLTNNFIDVENDGKISFSIGDNDKFREDRFELLFTKKTISVDGDLLVSSYAIYPNPSSTNTFNVTNDVKNNLKSVTIYDATGKQVFTKEISRNFGVNPIELPSNVKSGMYFVTLQGEHHTENKTLIIQ